MRVSIVEQNEKVDSYPRRNYSTIDERDKAIKVHLENISTILAGWTAEKREFLSTTITDKMNELSRNYQWHIETILNREDLSDKLSNSAIQELMLLLSPEDDAETEEIGKYDSITTTPHHTK